MNYRVEEIKHPVSEHYSWSEYKVLDENGVQHGETFLEPMRANWLAEDLTAGKKQLTDDEAFDLANTILSEIEQAHEAGVVQQVEEKIVSVPADRNEVIISGEQEVGTIIEYRGEQWLVTHCAKETEVEGAVNDECDERLSLGWHSWLVRLDAKVMEVVAEQYAEGAVRFTDSTVVRFADEDFAHSLFDLAYSADGLYDKTRQ